MDWGVYVDENESKHETIRSIFYYDNTIRFQFPGLREICVLCVFTLYGTILLLVCYDFMTGISVMRSTRNFPPRHADGLFRTYL